MGNKSRTITWGTIVIVRVRNHHGLSLSGVSGDGEKWIYLESESVQGVSGCGALGQREKSRVKPRFLALSSYNTA